MLRSVLEGSKSLFRTLSDRSALGYKNFLHTMADCISNNTSCVKRPAEDEDEAWTKRIELEPVSLGEEENKFVRQKKGKYAILLSFCGKGYMGMQRNPGFSTIEECLLTALCKTGLISEEDKNKPRNIGYQSASRTDKGVSATHQVVSLKLPDDCALKIEEVNKYLPDEIAVLKFIRVTRGFNAKLYCDSRSYSYLMPTFAFLPLEKTVTEYARIDSDILSSVRAVLAKYTGTHNFHNFTARKKSDDTSAKRYIMKFTCSDPFLKHNIEWVRIKVQGQSFMLHQIRKMIGLTIAISRGFVGTDILEKAWSPNHCDIPIAPSLGLVLEQPHYDTYNKRYGADKIHEQLDWSSVEEEVQTFREQFIDCVIYETEIRDKSMFKWLETLPLHSFDMERGTETKELPPGLVKTLRVVNSIPSAEYSCNSLSSNTEVPLPDASPEDKDYLS